ncbi:StAR-related lipid transfer protein 7, mitochondrial-like isoform X2 [Oopsacas minuta]|uniref:StAR-related lipid transfer protein 7, mitochondrial-like isoform X2 n=1 Tax=Oopsacas minuta TaxID=111878 RepID=A0AAV7JZ43_9METZ|nr:StAR-related lipid transfer protein 7, mitochondrial-like isoform X2 [Oopsacas minuta]
MGTSRDTQLPCSPTEYTSTSSKEEKSKSNIKWWKSPLVSNDTKNNLCENGWECLVSKSDIVIFRKPKENSAAYIYKVFGRNFDISAADFFFSQVDNSYRKTWDKYVWDIVCLGEDKESKQQLLYWVVKYPVSSKDTVYAGYKHHPLEIGYHIYSCIFIPVIRTCIATPKDVLSSYVQPASTVLKIYFYELIKRNFTRIELLNLCELLVPEN